MEMKIKMEMVEEEETKKPWKTVNNNKKKQSWRSFGVNSIRPQWDALPSLALLEIFINLNYKDRFGSIPLVCKSWNSVISNYPRCWSSMIPKSISPDDPFIKKPNYSVPYIPSKLYDRSGREVVRDSGVSHLRKLIKKSSSSGSTSTITSLFLDPFHFSNPELENNDSLHQDEILHLIANCCPNLKHICFDGFNGASIEAVLEIFQKCKKIELIDFSDSGYAESEEVIVELGNCLPNLRGIRIAGWINNYSIYDAIATHLPRIKLLAVDYEGTWDKDLKKLTSETECCLNELQYLSVGIFRIVDPPVCTHIPEFHYEKMPGYTQPWSSWWYYYDYDVDDEDFFRHLCSVHHPLIRTRRRHVRYTQLCYTCFSIKREEEAKEAISEWCHEFDKQECLVMEHMKQKKEYGLWSYFQRKEEEDKSIICCFEKEQEGGFFYFENENEKEKR